MKERERERDSTNLLAFRFSHFPVWRFSSPSSSLMLRSEGGGGKRIFVGGDEMR